MSETKRRYLFICAANQNRSPTAEKICRELAAAAGADIECSSAGIDRLSEKKISKTTAERADLIFVMEEYMKAALVSEFQQPGEKVICLDIEDVYPRGDTKLAALLRSKLQPYFDI